MSSRPPRDLWAPLTLWGHVWRGLLAAVTGAALFLMSNDPQVSRPLASWVPLVDVVVGLLSLSLLPLHRRFPVVVPVLLQAVTAVSMSSAGTASVALVSVATRRRWPRILLAGGVAMMASLAVSRLYRETDPMPAPLNIATMVLVLAAQVAWGLYIGARRDLLATWQWRAEAAEREQAARVSQAQIDERSRIAREMHDVLAHRISLISMHAGAVAYRTDLPPEEVRAEAGIIQRTAADALDELRDILGVLRQTPVGGAESSVEAPQPTFADIPDLVAQARQAGLSVTVVDEIAPGAGVPAQVGRHAYRMLQEALTNVRKHAPGAQTTVRVAGHPGGRLRLEVVNTPVAVWRSPASPLLGAGLGLVGLHERAHIVGGTITHGETSDGGYRMTAELPWPKEAT
ncbi:sensor histidine kinase [Arsenicicoccus sp. oral taxon 190]|uniref:sensor histidine kinase n=1 Tax=Arsenicicoccus sp. oral taxon 190 TaxID=1658671 RepID=UPI00067A38A2|nr:sensor histidine kinase [Arsenicicoccus sp. oral taxon 190]AKT51705.1 hypothetical protein ADJ73_11190 [Arsenicicoccus sp. oral taxon 190]